MVAAGLPQPRAVRSAEKLQMGEISMMPEGLVKISSGLYETILPMVKAQVESQMCALRPMPLVLGTQTDARTRWPRAARSRTCRAWR